MKECKGFSESAGRISSLNICLWEYLLLSDLYNSEQVEEWGSLKDWRNVAICCSVHEPHHGDTH